MQESNVGQIVVGPYVGNTVVINVAGEAMPLAQVDRQHLERVRAALLAAIRKRHWFASIPPLCTAALTVTLLLQLPGILETAPASVSKGLGGAILMLTFFIGPWMFVRAQFGSWLRRQKATITHLENTLAAVEAELDVRAVQAGSGPIDWLRSLIESLRA